MSDFQQGIVTGTLLGIGIVGSLPWMLSRMARKATQREIEAFLETKPPAR